MCASTVIESARSRPWNRGRALAVAAAGRPYAPSTCSQTPCSAQTSAMPSRSSTAPASVEPPFATTAIGVAPAARSAAMARGQRCDVEAPLRVHRQRDHAVGADAEHLDRALHGVVRVDGGVDPRLDVAQAAPARARHGALAGGRERGHVGDRAAARDRAGPAGEADELADPAQHLALDRRRGAAVGREVDVEGGGERVRDDADLQARRADEGEVARPRGRDRLVEHPLRVPQRLGGGRRRLGQRRGRAGAARRRRDPAARAARGRSSARRRAMISVACCSTSSRGASRRSSSGSPRRSSPAVVTARSWQRVTASARRCAALPGEGQGAGFRAPCGLPFERRRRSARDDWSAIRTDHRRGLLAHHVCLCRGRGRSCCRASCRS